MRALLLALAVTGCAGQPPVLLCPTLATYSKADQKALASELTADGPVTERFLADYVALRDAVRVCAK